MMHYWALKESALGKLRASLTSVDLKDKYRNLKMARQRRESRMD